MGKKIIIDDEQSYQIYTKKGVTKFYINGTEVEGVQKVRIDYDVEKGIPKITFKIKGTPLTGMNVATLDRENYIGKI